MAFLASPLLSLRARISAGFAVLIVLQVCVAVAVVRADRQSQSAIDARTEAEGRNKLATRAANELVEMRGRLLSYLHTAAATDLVATRSALAEFAANTVSEAGLAVELRSVLDATVAAAVAQREAMAAVAAASLRTMTAADAFARALSSAAGFGASVEARASLAEGANVAAGIIRPLVLVNRYTLSLDPDDAAPARAAAAAANAALQAMENDLSATGAGLPPRLARMGGHLADQLNNLPKVIDGLEKSSSDQKNALAAMDAAVARTNAAMSKITEAIALEQDSSMATITRLRGSTQNTEIVATAISIVLGLLFAALAGLSITRPLGRIGQVMRRIADGTLDIDVPDQARRDEVGGMAAAVEVFRQNMIRTKQLTAEQAALKAEAAARNAAMMEAETAKRVAEAGRRAAEAELALGQERERADQELHIQAVRFAVALSTMSEVLCLFDAADRLVVGNDRLAAMFDLPAGSITLGMTIQDMVSLHSAAPGRAIQGPGNIFSLILHLREAGVSRSQAEDMADGRRIAVNFAPMAYDGWLVTLEDITEQRRTEARIQHMAHHDALTGLPNRVLFHSRLEHAMARCRRGERCAVLYLDLDHFKTVNDTLGHPAGDTLLRDVTQRLKLVVREVDTVARLGGDEFAIVQSISQPTDSVKLAERVIRAISAPYEINGNNVIIGASIGIAIAPDNGEDVDEIIKNADMALYQSKADGRGRYQFFEAKMDARMQARRILDLDLRNALADSQFRVFYQPLIRIADRSVCGFEALVRWRHPQRGMVSPAEFIPMAEETGLIVPLGRWVLRQACADAATWPGDIKVAVNLSPVQFGSQALVADVAAALADTGLHASRLELEITETAMLEDTDAVLLILHQLRDLGLRIALDDFGTGYSSLSYLQRFPFAKVKIDRSFVAKLGRAGDNDTIVAAVVDLCGRLRMVTTAEGIETAEQLDRLASLRCVEGQGYLFSAPRPASEVVAMLASAAERTVAAAPRAALTAHLG
jgi:diguanylate cyclase (GGDEF)-like protein